MRAELVAAAAVVAAAVGGVRYWEAHGPGAEGRPAPSLAVASPAAPPAGHAYRDEVRIRASRDQQFYVTAAVNNAPSSFLVDTGAGYVALRESVARAAGVYPAWTDFTHPVRTANGETKAAFVELDVVEVGALRLENVKAFILADDQLDINLLGMSFLSRLESVEARAGELVLRG